MATLSMLKVSEDLTLIPNTDADGEEKIHLLEIPYVCAWQTFLRNFPSLTIRTLSLISDAVESLTLIRVVVVILTRISVAITVSRLFSPVATISSRRGGRSYHCYQCPIVICSHYKRVHRDVQERLFVVRISFLDWGSFLVQCSLKK